MRKVKISELPQSEVLTGLYTIGTDANNRSVKVPLQFLKEKTDEATAAAAEAVAAMQTIDAKVESLSPADIKEVIGGVTLTQQDINSSFQTLIDSIPDDFIQEVVPTTTVSASYGLNSVDKKYNYTMTDNTITSDTTAGWRMYWTLNKVPKGTWVHLKITYSTAHAHAWLIASDSPQEYYVNNSNNLVGFEFDDRIFYNSGAKNIEGWFKMPYDAYLLYRYCTSKVSVALSVTYQPIQLLTDIMSEYYSKGIADGSAMASIAGLGYDITEYLTFTKMSPVDRAGFKYGCDLRANYIANPPAVTGNGMFKSNTSLVYMPIIPQGAITTYYTMFQSCTKLAICVMNLNMTGSAYQMFNGCTALKRVELGTGFVPTSMEGCFRSCNQLTNIGVLNTSECTTWQYAFAVGGSALTRIEEIDFTKCSGIGSENYNSFRAGGTGATGLRYMLIKNLGTPSGCTSLVFKDASVWGVASTAVTDARQSIVDSLLTYSFDRETAGYNDCTITLSAASLAVLTEEEKTAITAKGYILTSA